VIVGRDLLLIIDNNPNNIDNININSTMNQGSRVQFVTSYGQSIISAQDEKNLLDRNYPIGTSYTCFYDQTDPYKHVDTKYYESVFQGFAIFVTLGISFLGLVIVGIYILFQSLSDKS
jgi:hypothetical protein